MAHNHGRGDQLLHLFERSVKTKEHQPGVKHTVEAFDRSAISQFLFFLGAELGCMACDKLDFNH